MMHRYRRIEVAMVRVFLCIVMVFAGGVGGLVLGRRAGKKEVYNKEMGIYLGALAELHGVPDGTRFREFLKARYYAAAGEAGVQWMTERYRDFGPPDKELLRGIPTVGGDVSATDAYARFQARAN